MKIYIKNKRTNKRAENNVPNVMAFTMIRKFLSNREYEDMRREYFLNNLSKKQVDQIMRDIKVLFRDYKGLDVVTIENDKGEINKFIL